METTFYDSVKSTNRICPSKGIVRNNTIWQFLPIALGLITSVLIQVSGWMPYLLKMLSDVDVLTGRTVKWLDLEACTLVHLTLGLSAQG